MTKQKLGVAAVFVAAAAAISGGIAYGAGSDSDVPITGPALAKASQAALAHTGGGRVSETEVGDEESLYEVEVTLPDGHQVDVQLDAASGVVGQAADDDSSSDTDGSGG